MPSSPTGVKEQRKHITTQTGARDWKIVIIYLMALDLHSKEKLLKKAFAVQSMLRFYF